jgi:hypothetical protein
MAILAKLPGVRALFCVAIAFGLLLAPLQGIGAVQAAAGMAMSGETCSQKQSCCDEVKADCSMSLSCLAKCGSFAGSALLGETLRLIGISEPFSTSLIVLTPYASDPLRRPPRA